MAKLPEANVYWCSKAGGMQATTLILIWNFVYHHIFCHIAASNSNYPIINGGKKRLCGEKQSLTGQ